MIGDEKWFRFCGHIFTIANVNPNPKTKQKKLTTVASQNSSRIKAQNIEVLGYRLARVNRT
jgi:hypothetical protein